MTPDAPFLFYVLDDSPAAKPARTVETRWWRPTIASIRPVGFPFAAFAVWWLFHQLRLFYNRDYALLGVYKSGMLVHHTCIFPGYFRFPFMGRDDLQLGDIWTAPSQRARGLAGMALAECIGRLARPGRRLWYVVHQDNHASIRLAEKAGFTLHAQGVRTSRFGLRPLGCYRITAHTTPNCQNTPSRAA